jgi:Caspase domain
MKGYSILVGVTEVSLKHYTQQVALPCAKTDVNVMNDMLEQLKIYESPIHKLIDENANSITFFGLLERYKEISKSEEGFLVIYFSGHGASIPYNDDKQKEFLCFQDRMVLENEIRKHLCEFDPKFKILFVIDSCYSSGIAEKMLQKVELDILDSIFPFGEKVSNPSFLSPLENTITHFIENKDFAESANFFITKKTYEKRLRKGILFDTFRKNEPHYLKMLNDFKSDYDNYPLDVCYLNACQKNQTTEIGPLINDPSYFTHRLKIIWKKHHQNAVSYESFIDILSKNMRLDIQPSLKIYPNIPQNFFYKTTPFYFDKNVILKTMTMAQEIYLEEQHNFNVVATLSDDLQIFKAIRSNTYDRVDQSQEPFVKYLESLLAPIPKAVRFIAVIDVEVAQYIGFPHTISNLYSKKDDPDGTIKNGLVILLENNSNVKSKKRTAGKVSNKQGG